MPQKQDDDSQMVRYVLGEQLLRCIQEAGLTEEQLAQRACVSPQTVRNYQGSGPDAPWAFKEDKLAAICRVLKCDPETMKGVTTRPKMAVDADVELADLRFSGNPDTVRSITGKWRAESIDITIPDFITYTAAVPWHADLEIRQAGNRFEAHGNDKDDDGVFARGTLLESGNWIRFTYWIDNERLREYGTAMVEYKGCGRKMEGLFMGRDCGNSSIGMVVARLTLTRIEEEGISRT